jgi:hypothetical protein
MDLGTVVKCQCGNEYCMYMDTHRGRDGMVGGMCPKCNYWNTVMLHKKTEDYHVYPHTIKYADAEEVALTTRLPYYPGDEHEYV